MPLKGQVETMSLLRTKALLSFDDPAGRWTNYSAAWMRRRGNLGCDGLAVVRQGETDAGWLETAHRDFSSSSPPRAR